MTILKHALSIGIERVDNQFYLFLKTAGKLTHSDYEKITPMIDSALNAVKDPKINILIDGADFEGWEVRAAWDDFKLALKHGNEFKKIAIFGNKGWQEITAKIGSWFLSGKVKYFDSENDTLFWLNK